MNSAVLLCVIVLFAGVYAHSEFVDKEAQEKFSKLKRECITEHNISALELDSIQSHDFSGGSENVKCFTKCILNKSGIVSDSGVDVEKSVSFAVAKGHDADKSRENALKCKALFKGSNDCETSYALLACFKKH